MTSYDRCSLEWFGGEILCLEMCRRNPNLMVTSQVISPSFGHVESRFLYKMNLKQHNVGSHPAPEFVGWVEVGDLVCVRWSGF